MTSDINVETCHFLPEGKWDQITSMEFKCGSIPLSVSILQLDGRDRKQFFSVCTLNQYLQSQTSPAESKELINIKCWYSLINENKRIIYF